MFCKTWCENSDGEKWLWYWSCDSDITRIWKYMKGMWGNKKSCQKHFEKYTVQKYQLIINYNNHSTKLIKQINN